MSSYSPSWLPVYLPRKLRDSNSKMFISFGDEDLSATAAKVENLPLTNAQFTACLVKLQVKHVALLIIRGYTFEYFIKFYVSFKYMTFRALLSVTYDRKSEQDLCTLGSESG